MIWLAIALLAAVALAPLALSLRRAAVARGRREAAIALHRAQLAELDRDLADGRIAAAEHASAVLEVQRRSARCRRQRRDGAAGSSRSPVLIALVLVPLGGLRAVSRRRFAELPAAPLAERIAAAQAARASRRLR